MPNNVDNVQGEQNTNFVGKDGFYWFMGEIEDIEDPLNLGRVKCRALNYYTSPAGNSADAIPTKDLPWATVLQHTSQAGNDGQGESSGQLQPGAIVMGFFMDGESAQMPVIWGVMRVDKNEPGNQNKEKQLLTGEDIPKGLGANASTIPAGEVNTSSGKKQQGTQNNSVSLPNAGVGPLPGSGSPTNIANAPGVSGSSTNAQKPTTPSKPIPTASGTGGPWKTLEYQLTYLVEDIASTAGNLVSNGEGSFIDVIENKVVTLDSLLAKAKNFLSALFAQIISAMRLQLNALVDSIEGGAGFIASLTGIPGAAYTIIANAIQAILSQLCILDDQLLSMIANPIGVLTSMVESLLNGLISKAEAALQGVQDLIDSIICQVQNILNQIMSVINAVRSVVDGIGNITEIIDAWQEGSQIFTDGFDIMEKGLDGLVGILSLIFQLFDLGCNREAHGGRDAVGWFPFFGTTSCNPSALAAIPMGNAHGSCGGGSGGGFLDSFFEEADPYLTTAKNFISGAYEMQMGTPGRQATIRKTASGTTTTSIKQNNASLAEHKARKEIRMNNPTLSDSQVESQVKSYVKSQTSSKEDQGNLVADHTAYAGNHTQEVHGDDCKVTDGDYVRTINGDYRLKVTGNCHIEVGGGYFFNAQGGPKQVDNNGKDESNNSKIQKHIMSFGSDLDMSVNGADFKLQAMEMNFGARDIKMSGSSYNNSCKVNTDACGEKVINAGNSFSVNTKNVTMLVNTLGIPAAAGGMFFTVGGPVVWTQSQLAAAPAAYTITTPATYRVQAIGAVSIESTTLGVSVKATAGALALEGQLSALLKSSGNVNINAGPLLKCTATAIHLN